MDHYHQFNDLPQISVAEDSLLNSWSNDYVGHMHYGRHRTVTVFGEDIALDEVNGCSMSGMQPLQRFLQGPDRSPLAAGLLHAKFNYGNHYQSRQLRQCEQAWPSANCIDYDRDPSPETSSSGHSSLSTQNELYSPPMLNQIPYNSQTECIQPRHIYPDPEQSNGGAYPSEVPTSSANISLRDLEYTHQEPEPTIEDHDHDHVDTKPELEYDQEPNYSNVEVVRERYQSSIDSTLGRSLRGESVQPMDYDEEASDSDYRPKAAKANKKRRTSQSSNGSGRQTNKRGTHGRKASTASTISNNNRVTKKTRGSNAINGNINGANSPTVDKLNPNAQRPFPCPLVIYGCTSNFVSKNEWKRHVSSQHIKLGFWRCDLCPTTVDTHDPASVYHNDFNRKDLFTQHLRRMHAAPAHQSPATANRNHKEYPVNEDNLGEHQNRCYKVLRSPPPQSSCPLCDDRTFQGPGSWDERMEHVGRHLEKDRKAGGAPIDFKDWEEDIVLRDWLHAEGLIALDRNNAWKLGDGKPKRGFAHDDDEDSDANE